MRRFRTRVPLAERVPSRSRELPMILSRACLIDPVALGHLLDYGSVPVRLGEIVAPLR